MIPGQVILSHLNFPSELGCKPNEKSYECMRNQIKNLHLSIEKAGLSPINYSNDHTDAIVETHSGEMFIATFFAYKNLEKMNKMHERNGEYLNGNFFWVDRMVFVKDISRGLILEVIEKLIDDADFNLVFKKI